MYRIYLSVGAILFLGAFFLLRPIAIAQKATRITFSPKEIEEITGDLHESGVRRDVWNYIQNRYPKDARKRDAAEQTALAYQKKITAPNDARKNLKETDLLLMCAFFLFGENEDSRSAIYEIRDKVINSVLRSKAKLAFEYAIGSVNQAVPELSIKSCNPQLIKKYSK